ncbi:MAG: hypothetical protein U0M42_09475 [Acutalibacteraceae bacterium]|nr:hypothetical protein [Acutalibacteraceae bacterium]
MKNFFTSLCFILVAVGSASFVKNTGELKKITSFVFAVTVICSVMSVLSKSEIKQFDFNTDYTDAAVSFSASEEAFVLALEKMLEDREIQFDEIRVSSSKREDMSINIEKIYVKGVKDKEAAFDIIKENTGIEEIEVS